MVILLINITKGGKMPEEKNLYFYKSRILFSGLYKIADREMKIYVLYEDTNEYNNLTFQFKIDDISFTFSISKVNLIEIQNLNLVNILSNMIDKVFIEDKEKTIIKKINELYRIKIKGEPYCFSRDPKIRYIVKVSIIKSELKILSFKMYYIKSPVNIVDILSKINFVINNLSIILENIKKTIENIIFEKNKLKLQNIS
jgi:hypothetical protein